MSDEEYVPPVKSVRFRTFIDTPLKQLQDNVVSCSTCPVFLQCQAGEGGTGWVCPVCNGTAVHVTDQGDEMPKDLLVIDCGNHQFKREAEKAEYTICALCTGNQMELELTFPDSRVHYQMTAYMRVSMAERQRVLKKAFEHWTTYYATRKAETDAEKEE